MWIVSVHLHLASFPFLPVGNLAAIVILCRIVVEVVEWECVSADRIVYSSDITEEPRDIAGEWMSALIVIEHAGVSVKTLKTIRKWRKKEG